MSVLKYLILVIFYLYVIAINLTSYLSYITDMTGKFNYDYGYKTYKEYIKKNKLLKIINFLFKIVTILIILIIIKTLTIKLIYGN
jgi:hypothetical protein